MARTSKGSAAERRRLRDEWYATGIVSCPDCGVLCWRYPEYRWDGELYDVRLKDVGELVTTAVGLEAVLSQGVGVGNGGSHVCPPTRNLFGDVMEIGVREEERGGEW